MILCFFSNEVVYENKTFQTIILFGLCSNYVIILVQFILNITANELKQLENHFSHKFPKKYIWLFNIFTGIGICLLWLGTIIPSFGSVPDGLEHYTTLVIQAMDLGFIVPVAVLSGVFISIP